MARTKLPDTLKLGALTAALLVAGAGMPALADPPADEQPLEGSFDQPLGGRGENDASGPQTKMIMSSSDDSGNYKIEISGNKIKAWHNDKVLSKDRVRRSKEKVELLDGEGNVMHTFPLSGFGSGGLPGFGDQNGRFFLRVPGGAGGPDTPQPPQPPQGGDMIIRNAPPVMIGITMSEADEEMLADLSDEDFEAGIVIDKVVEGLPAARAGLKPHDIIIEIAGERPATQDVLREVLSGRKAGDELVVKILRDRKLVERKIRLEKFDPSKLGIGGQAAVEGDGPARVEIEGLPDVLKLYGQQGKVQWEEARKAIEEAMRELEENEDLKPEKIRGHAQKALEEAMKALAEAEKQGTMQWRNFMGGGEGGQVPRTWMWSDKPGQLYAVPPSPSAPRADSGETSRKLDRLSDQLERLNRRLDELERRLDSRPRERNP